MSYATMYRMPVKGELEEVKDYGNAFGGAMRIWEPLFKKWINTARGLMVTLMSGDREFWDLAKDERLPESDRIVLASTYDKAVVPSEMLGRFVEALREFDTRHPAGTMVSHVRAWAYDIEAMISEGMEGFIGICFNQTSVTETWTVFDEDDEDGEERLYDASRDEGHWFITDSAST